MSDHSSDTPDQLAVAASAELSAIEARLTATWDVEAGLRDILLQGHYHQFIADAGTGFDVEAGLAAIIATDALPQNSTAPVDRQLQSPPTNCLHHKTETADGRDAADHLSTIDKVWAVANEAQLFLRQLRDPWRENQTADHLGDLLQHLSTAVRKSDDLAHLAVNLDQGIVTLDQATEIVNGMALALMELSTTLSYYLKRGPDGNKHPDVTRIWELARHTASLKPPIKRLFEPSNDVVDALG
ncbi:hypothetical protein [Micromonospora sp. NPDC051141]|uniref:hypothetical protein n=1 Tax=Micromonospora sp. NPDC051141 TaxID=3364284 RepID=UPI0037B2EA41